MGGMKELFEMSRHQRRGSIVVLALIALLLAATVAMRHCGSSVQPVQSIDIQDFAAEADTTLISTPKRVTKPSSDSKGERRKPRRHRPASPRKPKPAPAPRRLDPVPQFRLL